MVMGKISAGKSSLLNKTFGLKLAVGVGETTMDAMEIGEFSTRNGRVKIFDSPGVNEDFCFTDPQTLNFINDMDKIFICYNTSIK